MYSKKEREEYNRDRARICGELGITKNNYNWIRRAGQRLRGIYTDSCNGTISEQEYDSKTTRIYEACGKYVGKLKLYIYYQPDPRGATIYLDVKPIPVNSYTNARCIF